jgi:hypothetical protein
VPKHYNPKLTWDTYEGEIQLEKEEKPLSQAQEASYIVYIGRDGYVKAKNGRTGHVEFRDRDAGTVIQSAINSLKDGGKVLIKKGVYDVNNISLISNLHLVGEKGAVLRCNSPNSAILVGSGISDVVVEGLELDGQKSLYEGTGGIDFSANVTRFIIKDCYLHDFGSGTTGLWFAIRVYGGSQHGLIVNNVVYNCDRDGIFVAGDGTRDVVVGFNTLIDAQDAIVYIALASKGVIIGNDIRFIDKKSVGFGLDLSGSSEVTAVGNVIDSAQGPTFSAIMVRSYTSGSVNCQSKNVVVQGNVIIFPRIGIWVRSDMSDMPVLNCVVADNIVVGHTAIGIYVYNYVDTLIVEGNIVRDGVTLSDYGAYDFRVTPLGGLINNALIIGNVAVNNAQGYGFYMVGYGSGIQFTRIRILDNLAYGNGAGDWYIATGYFSDYVIKNNKGYDTENFKATGVSVTVGTGGVYGSAKTITSPSGVITYPRVKITWGGTFGTGETVTVKVEAVYSDGTTAYVEKSATATGSLWLTDDDVLALITQGKDIVNLNIYAKTNLSSTTVTVTVDAYGKA